MFLEPLDGNKRTAAACAEVFLLLNDMRLSATSDVFQAITLGVAASRVSKEETTAFFVRYAVPGS